MLTIIAGFICFVRKICVRRGTHNRSIIKVIRNFAMMKAQKTIFIVAGEPSGDLHGARLMRAIKSVEQNTRFVGIGGKAMEAEGLSSIVSLHEISVVGFWEVAKKYIFFKNLLRHCAELLHEQKVDMFIPVDYPGFNMRLSEHAKRGGIPVYWYIAPQLWAWGKKRAKTLAQCVDRLMVVFPFEVDFFKQFGIETTFVGHPLLDDPIFSAEQEVKKTTDKVLALLPGSRRQEIYRNLPTMLKAAEIVNRSVKSEICIPLSSTIAEDIYREVIHAHYNSDNISLVQNSRELMKRADVGIVKTGTSTLEAALCALPFSMMYKTSALSYFIGKYLVNVPFIALPNILLQKGIVHEFVQNDAIPEVIARETIELLRNEQKRKQLLTEFEKVRAILGGSGASANAANLICDALI